MSKSEELYRVLRLVRPLHQYSAKAVADTLHEQAVSMPMRAVLEQLRDAGALTVPQVARLLWLPRQVVQRLADEAATLGLLAWQENPAHRRSRLATLTAEGAAAFAALHARELANLAPIAASVSQQDIAACVRVMTVLTDGIREVASRREEEDEWPEPGPLPIEEMR